MRPYLIFPVYIYGENQNSIEQKYDRLLRGKNLVLLFDVNTLIEFVSFLF